MHVTRLGDAFEMLVTSRYGSFDRFGEASQQRAG